MNKPVTTAEIVRIGNSKGLRIPKAIRERLGLEGKVTLEVEGSSLIVRKKRNPRAGWAKQYAGALREQGPEEKLWPDGMTEAFDDTEWTW
ncbi:MAG: AbrB/MazE/SpoVT family DNA-binding domain-containing protein [Rhizomicrobium sp.]